MSLFKKKKEEKEEKAKSVSKITPDRVRKALNDLIAYKNGKSVLEDRVIKNEQWWRQRHWQFMDDKGGGDRQPTSAWLFNSICNKHADAMDNMPMPNILPREESDKHLAEGLSAIIPLVLEQNNFEETYSNAYDDKLIAGTGIIGVFWDPTKLNGLGDISIVQQDVLNLFWEPGISDIQESQNVFSVQYVNNETLHELYPDVKLKGSPITLAEYEHDDTVDRSEQTAVIDWYYHKNGVLHMAKLLGETVLYATEDDPNWAERGLYDHGMYPFVFDPCYRIKGSPCGFGQIDVSKSAQGRIDRLQQAIDKNAVIASKPRFFYRRDCKIDLKKFADTSVDMVPVDGHLDEESLRQIVIDPLPGIAANVLLNTIEELKETSGNRDFSQGSTASGVTSGAAIAALQEAGTKLSRDMQKRSYRVYKQMILLVIELIRQFYDEPRQFRILGKSGEETFINYDNAELKETKTITWDGEDVYRKPTFDISINAEKESPFARMSQNDLALQLYNMQFFNPQNYESALTCLQMMTFDGKDEVMSMVAANGQRMMAQQQAIQQQAMMDAQAEMGAMNDQDQNMQGQQQIYPQG